MKGTESQPCEASYVMEHSEGEDEVEKPFWIQRTDDPYLPEKPATDLPLSVPEFPEDSCHRVPRPVWGCMEWGTHYSDHTEG